jgi:hypothetical protein
VPISGLLLVTDEFFGTFTPRNPLNAYKIKLLKITFLNFEAELNSFLDSVPVCDTQLQLPTSVSGC